MSWSSLAFAANPPAGPAGVDVKVTNVQENMAICRCDRPEYLGRVCIARTKYSLPASASQPGGLPPQAATYGLTSFEARMDGNDVVLTSKAYYERCIYDETTIRFTEPEIQDLFRGQKAFGVEGVRGEAAWMQVGFLLADGGVRFEPAVKGSFTEEKLWSERGTRYEAYRQEYPGIAEFRKPLFGFLTDFQIRMVLDGDVFKRRLKAWLAIERGADGAVRFGEYTVTLKFFRKAKPKALWDASVIGIEVLPENL